LTSTKDTNLGTKKEPSAITYALGGAVTAPAIGISNRSKEKVHITDQRRSTHIIGTHGTGKSTLLLNSFLSDVKSNDKGVVLLDPHGDLARDAISRCPEEHADRVIYFSPNIGPQIERPLGLNPFEWSSRSEFELKAGAILDTFTHLWYGDFSSTPTLQHTLEVTTKTLLNAYPSHATSFYHMFLMMRRDEIGKSARNFLSEFVSNNPALLYRWELWNSKKGQFERDTESSEKKINHIIATKPLLDILAQPKTAKCLNFEELLSNRGVLVVNLEGIDKEGQKLIGSIILTQLAVMGRLRRDKATREPCHIYADEFYNFAPASFVTIINELRKFGLFCTLAHQSLAQLDTDAKAAVGNCANKVIFQVNPSDAKELASHFRILEESISLKYIPKEESRLNSDSFSDIVREHVVEQTWIDLPAGHLSNMPPYYALAKCAKGSDLAQDNLVKTFPPKGVDEERVAEKIINRSAQHGTPLSDLVDIIERENNLFQTLAQPQKENKTNSSVRNDNVNKSSKSDRPKPNREKPEPEPTSKQDKKVFWE